MIAIFWSSMLYAVAKSHKSKLSRYQINGLFIKFKKTLEKNKN